MLLQPVATKCAPPRTHPLDPRPSRFSIPSWWMLSKLVAPKPSKLRLPRTALTCVLLTITRSEFHSVKPSLKTIASPSSRYPLHLLIFSSLHTFYSTSLARFNRHFIPFLVFSLSLFFPGVQSGSFPPQEHP